MQSTECGGGGGVSVWQRGDGEAAWAVGAVFAWLSGAELVVAGRVCRAWRRAAAEPALWRRALVPRAGPAQLHALRRALAAATLHRDRSWCAWSWRREYLLAAARWRRRARAAAAASGARATHAQLSHCGRRLAVAAEDASLTMWERSGAGWGSWRRCWWRSERAHGWAAVGAVRWAPGDARLLFAGPLALADRWELLVLRFDESGRGAVQARAGCSACGGWWAGPDDFVTVTVRLLAPARAVSTVWLNAADQKLQSEYAGVTAPVLRVYNEAAASVTHLIVADVPAKELKMLEVKTEAEDPTVSPDGGWGPAPGYWRATLPVHTERSGQVVVLATGAPGGPRGVACALGAWRLPARSPPPLLAGASLAERVRVRRAAPPPPPPPPAAAPPPEEAELRALCTPPLATCRVRCRVLGLQTHPNGGCVWVSTRAGAECVSLPALRPLLRVHRAPAPCPAPCSAHTAPPAPPHTEPPYSLQAAVSDDFVITPAGGGALAVLVWAARSGVGGAELPHATPPVAALLAAHPHHLLVLAGAELYVWTSSILEDGDR